MFMAARFDLSKLETESPANLLALSRPIKRGTKQICIKCGGIQFNNYVQLRQHMLDAHQTKIMFSDLDPSQQEKTVRAYEIYADISYTDFKYFE